MTRLKSSEDGTVVVVSPRCAVCDGTDFTEHNYDLHRRIAVPGGPVVHMGCLGSWLVEDALARNFPGVTPRERDVMRLRLRLPDLASEPNLRSLDEVGERMGWTMSMRASQVQGAAMSRFESNVQAERRATEHEADAPRRHLSFVAIGDASPGFRASEAEEILEREFGR